MHRPADVPDVRASRRLMLLLAATVVPAALAAQAGTAGVIGTPTLRTAAGRAGPVPAASRCSSRSDLLARAPVTTRHPAAGLVVTAWNGTDGRGHQVRLTAAQADVAAVRLAAAAVGHHGEATPTTHLTRTVRAAVVGINGDYFGYDWSGAAVPDGPLVVGGRVLRLPPGAHAAVGADVSGRPFAAAVRVDGVVRLPATGRATGRVLPIASVNDEDDPDAADAVAAGRAVAAVTPYLGPARPWRRREVVVRRGAVVAAGHRLSFGVDGRFGSGRAGRDDVLLAADGAAARTLRGLGRGSAVRVRYVARTRDGSRAVQAIGSGAVMLRHGRDVAPCSGSATQSRPRTLVAWNASRRRLWLLTVDGRGGDTPVSRYGATYRQAAELARALGASEAVMLDGGGSTTMALRWPDGAVRRIDAPDEASQRPVPDGLVLIPR